MTTKLQYAKAQYNGMILLTSYTYRLFVQQGVMLKLKNIESDELYDKTKDTLDSLFLIISMFEQTKDLTIGQQAKIMELYEETKEQFQTFFGTEPLPFEEKAAIVTACFYGERYMNSKILHMSAIFNTDISNDFAKRMKFYDERIKLMDFTTHALSLGDPIDPKLTEKIESWYQNVASVKVQVSKDLERVPQFLTV